MAARRPPAQPGQQSARLVQIAGADRDQRQQFAGLIAATAPHRRQRLERLGQLGRVGRVELTLGREQQSPRSRSIGSSPLAAASCVERRQRSGLILLASLRLRFLQPCQCREAGRCRRPRGPRTARPPRPAGRRPGSLGGGEAQGLGGPRLRRHWSQPTLPAVPTTISTASARTRAAVAAPQPRDLVAPQLLVDLADELFRFHA